MLLAGELGTGEDATTDTAGLEDAETEVVGTGATGVLDALD